MSRKKFDASNSDFEVEDSPENLEAHVLRPHGMIACRDPEKCPIVLAAKDGARFEEFWVHRSVSYGRYAGGKKLYRWSNPPGTRDFLERFDSEAGEVGTKKRANWVKDNIPEEGIIFLFKPVSAARRLNFFRSPDFKNRRRLSAEKCKNKIKRRPYRLPDPKTLSGVRNRFGYHGSSD